MHGAMMFGPIVGSVVASGVPVVPELALGVVTTKPMESHIHRFGATWLYVVGDHAESSAVVSLDRCGGLLVSHLFQELLHGYRFTGIDVESTNSASVALAMIALRILEMLRMAPLSGGSSTSDHLKVILWYLSTYDK